MTRLRRALLIVTAGTLFGCASPRERLYTLAGPEPPAPPPGVPLLHVVLAPVTIPASVDRPQLIVRQGAVRVVALEQERWAEPLREAVPRVLAESMQAQLTNASVTSALGLAPARPEVRVSVDITRFEALPGERVIIEARWGARFADGRAAREGTSVARESVAGGAQDFEAVVAAEAAGLRQIGAEIARALN